MKLPLTSNAAKIPTSYKSIDESRNGKSEEQTRSNCTGMMTAGGRACPQSLKSLLLVSASWDIKHHENVVSMR